MQYRNVKTGAVIEAASVCSGLDWEEVAETAEKKTAAKPKATGKKTAAKTQQSKKDVKADE